MTRNVLFKGLNPLRSALQIWRTGLVQQGGFFSRGPLFPGWRGREGEGWTLLSQEYDERFQMWSGNLWVNLQ